MPLRTLFNGGSCDMAAKSRGWRPAGVLDAMWRRMPCWLGMFGGFEAQRSAFRTDMTKKQSVSILLGTRRCAGLGAGTSISRASMLHFDTKHLHYRTGLSTNLRRFFTSRTDLEFSIEYLECFCAPCRHAIRGSELRNEHEHHGISPGKIELAHSSREAATLS